MNNALKEDGKVFIHCSELQIGAIMAIGYLIGNCKVPIKQSLQIITKNQGIEISPHFMKQIEAYDLEKMAFISIQRE